MSALHLPVLKDEVVVALAPVAGERYVDGTFGAGGYTRALLEAADCAVIALDRDPSVLETAEKLTAEYPERFCFIQGTFAEMADLLAARGVTSVNAVVLDIGVSSMQIDQADRGFSFQKDGPLDMRMSKSGKSAADIVNDTEEAELADIIYHYGEERRSRSIARAIVKARAEGRIERTLQLAEIVRKGHGHIAPGKDAATRTFQALRIAVNDELGQLKRALEAAESILAEGGRLLVVTFHSLEDRIVKQFFQSRSGELPGVSRHMPVSAGVSVNTPTFFASSHRLYKPSAEEVRRNPRARSAKLRVAIRTAHALQPQA
jgi:16S rRNA (cytosine1402-N4)-methyltransferase